MAFVIFSSPMYSFLILFGVDLSFPCVKGVFEIGLIFFPTSDMGSVMVSGRESEPFSLAEV